VLAILREQIGYDGLVFTDDLEMRALADRWAPGEIARAALAAGVDALLVCSRADVRDAVLAALEAAPSSLVRDGLRRMAAFKTAWAGGRRGRGGEPPYAAHRELATRLS
jgi:beta-N-acetylhexosaminidase